MNKLRSFSFTIIFSLCRCSQEIRFVSTCKENRKHKKSVKDKHTNGKGNYNFNMTVPLCKKSQLTYNVSSTMTCFPSLVNRKTT